MKLLERYPQLAEPAISLAILLASYLVARAIAHLFGRLAGAAARRSATSLDERLLTALQAPLTYALFLAGAWVAVHRLPLPPAWSVRLDGVLYVLGVVLLALALLRSYGILMRWYMSRAAAQAGGPASEFGPLFSKVGKALIVLLAAIAVLQHVGVNVASLVVSLGVGSLAVGLAAQDTLANMIAGFTLMVDRPFRIGDRIQLASGEVGDVQAIGMRATEIRTLDESVLVIPNSVLVKERLVNQSRPSRAVAARVDLSIAHGSDPARVRQILFESIAATPLATPEPAAVAVVTRFGAFSIDFQLSFRVRDYTEQAIARGQVYEELQRRLADAGIELAVPIQRILHEPAPDEGAA